MQFKISALATLALATLAAATPTRRNEPASSCSTGPIQCCETVEKASDPAAATLIGLLGIVLQNVNVGVGLTCSPITVVGAGSGSWYAFACILRLLLILLSIALLTLSAARTTRMAG